jgi:hypothetical protein
MPAEKFRKLPVVIEAMQWTGDNIEEMWEWAGADHVYWLADTNQLRILTLEGDVRADRWDWVIKGVQQEVYPCKPDILAATYERVGGSSTGEQEPTP